MKKLNYKDIFENVKKVYIGLELRQKIVLTALFLLTVSVFIWLVSWSTKVEYNLLFGNMDPKEAAKVIESLRDQNINYRLDNNGRNIYIPANLLYETRIDLSTQGVGAGSSIGFEVFDRSAMGMTQFVQNINYKRAMEGELRRTIESINNVETARVHLVFPEDKLFKEDQKDATASVVLNLNRSLSQRQIEGIQNLVASAVEGLEVFNVTISDQNANLLTEHFPDNLSGLSNFQLRLQNQVENSLTTKIQSMLNNILGSGNSVTRVSAELNFDQIAVTSETFDPESRVIRSEEIQSSSTAETTTDENLERTGTITSDTENLITNYEISRTVQNITNQVGNIRRLSVAVNVNHRTDLREENGVLIREFVERTPEEIEQIELLVQNAVGFNTDRGDAIVVNSIRFDDSDLEYHRRQQESDLRRKEMIDLIEKGGILVILLVLAFVLFVQFKKIFASFKPEVPEVLGPSLKKDDLAEEGFYAEGEEGMPMGEGKISYKFRPMKDIEIEQTESLALQESVKKFIVDNPENAVKLIRSWMMEHKKEN